MWSSAPRFCVALSFLSGIFLGATLNEFFFRNASAVVSLATPPTQVTPSADVPAVDTLTPRPSSELDQTSPPNGAHFVNQAISLPSNGMKKNDDFADGDLPTSFFGGRPLCRTPFVERSFTRLEIIHHEDRLRQWIRHWEHDLENYLNMYPNRLRPGRERLADPVEQFHRPQYQGLKRNEMKQYQRAHGLTHRSFRIALPPAGPNCSTPIEKFGPAWKPDVQKAVCWSDKSLFSASDCHIISIGSHNEWETEEDMYKRTKCRIHTFDCNSDDSMPKYIRSRTKFYKKCVGPNKDQITWQAALRKIGTSKPPIYLKMDIEGWEYSVVRYMLHSSGYLLPEMISMEIHQKSDLVSGGGGIPWVIRLKEIPEFTGLALMMYEAGYRLIYIDWDTVCGLCLEVLWTRIFC